MDNTTLIFKDNDLKEKIFIKKFPDLYKEISLWNFPDDFIFSQKVYHYFHNDYNLEIGLCPICGNRCKFISFYQGYKHHCSPKCMYEDKSRIIKIKSTKQEKYGDENYNNFEKAKETNIIKYNGISPSLNKAVKEKQLSTLFNNYGVMIPMHSKEIKEKYTNTCQKKYGVSHPMKITSIKQKSKDNCEKKYNVKFGFLLPKSRETCKEKYGVEYYTQTSEFAKYHRKRISYDNITFDSSWEMIVYQYCKKYNIPFEYQPNIKFEYEYDNKKHYYQPDFLIDGKLYEVKGDQFFDGDKMINPFNRNLDVREEAKHQCIKNNNIIILKKDDIKKMKEML